LASRGGCAPTRFLPSQSRFDRIAALLGSDRNRGATVDVQPILLIGKRVHLERHSNLALAHDHLPNSGMFEYLHGEGSLIIHASDDVMTVLVHDAKLSRPERSKQLDPETLRYRRTFHGSTACNSDALGPTKTAYPAAGLLGGRPLNLLFKRAGTSFLVIALMFPEFKPFWVTRRSEIFQDRRKSEGNTDFHAY
jgi:hypothetical protein